MSLGQFTSAIDALSGISPYLAYVIPILTIVFWIVSGIAIKSLLGWMRRRTKANHHLSISMIAEIEKRVVLWFSIIGAIFSLKIVEAITPFTGIPGLWQAIYIALGLYVIIAISRFIVNAVNRFYIRKGVKPMTGFATNAIYGIILLIGLLTILGNVGIDITPMLTTLGVVALGISLALQDTLGNLFAGFYITSDKPFEVGDYIRLEGGDDGYVEHIGWRSTRIRTLPNNIVVIPNKKITESVLTNYYKPSTQMACLVNLNVAYGSDLENVERVTIDAARQIMKTARGGAPEFEPFIRYNTFGESGIGFTVIMRVNEYVDKYLVTHEFIKVLYKRYKEEGIEIPLPQRVLHIQNDKAKI
jgi:small-conductance mechanosensitive channel